MQPVEKKEPSVRRLIKIACWIAWGACCPAAQAGYEQPAYIDGCQSIDGRFVITAEQTERAKNVHGPHQWDFIWKDTQTGQSKRFPAAGIQGGQIYAQLFIAPDGETFALWNHITQYWQEKSHMHSHAFLPKRTEANEAEYRALDIHKKRLIIYSKDGAILKQFGVGDFLNDDEWESALAVFTRVHWLAEYDELTYRDICRMQYAFYRVSPDYTVLEFQPIPSRAKRRDPPRKVRVDLTTGRILDEDEELTDVNKIPVRPFVGPDRPPRNSKPWREGYTPSLDPVRVAGTYQISTPAEAFPLDEAPKLKPLSHGEVRLIADGYKKADTPAWLPKSTGKNEQPFLLFTDLEQEKLFQFTPPEKIEEIRTGASRGKAGPDKRFYGLFDGKIASWRPGEEPNVILESLPGREEISLNDIAVTSRKRIYFTTLKDPEKGRLSTIDPETNKVTVLFDGEDEPALANPNGVAVDPDERFLFVGISNYNNRKHSGVYCFPSLPDGPIDLDAGKDRPWAAVKAPDGIAVHRNRDVYFTAGNKVEVFDPYGRRRGQIKIPKGSGTNLCFDERGETLYITTWNALYAVEINQ